MGVVVEWFRKRLPWKEWQSEPQMILAWENYWAAFVFDLGSHRCSNWVMMNTVLSGLGSFMRKLSGVRLVCLHTSYLKSPYCMMNMFWIMLSSACMIYSIITSSGYGSFRYVVVYLKSMSMDIKEMSSELLSSMLFFFVEMRYSVFDCCLIRGAFILLTEILCDKLGGWHKKDERFGYWSSNVCFEDTTNTITREAPTISLFIQWFYFKRVWSCFHLCKLFIYFWNIHPLYFFWIRFESYLSLILASGPLI